MARIATTGAEFKKFYQDQAVWEPGNGESWYVEDETIEIDGDVLGDRLGDELDGIADDAQVVVVEGVMIWQGAGADPTDGEGKDLGQALAQWLREQIVFTVVATLEVPRGASPEQIAHVRAVLEGLGAAVQGLPGPDQGKPPAPKA